MNLKNVFVVLAIMLIMSCTVAAPQLARHTYLGTVTRITEGPAYQKVHLDNGLDYAAVDSVAIGDYVYRNPYGQLKIVSPE